MLSDTDCGVVGLVAAAASGITERRLQDTRGFLTFLANHIGELHLASF